MSLKKLSALLVIAGTLVIWSIKLFVRPMVHLSQPAQLIIDIAPNLLGAFLLPFGCCWLLSKYVNLQRPAHLLFFNTTCFILLIVNELLQLVPVFGRTFDVYDIAASAAGLAAATVALNNYFFKKVLAEYSN